MASQLTCLSKKHHKSLVAKQKAYKAAFHGGAGETTDSSSNPESIQ